MKKIIDPETVESYFHKLYDNPTFIKELSEYALSEVAILADRVINGRINAMRNKIAFMDPDQLGGGEPLNTYWQELIEGAREEGYSEKELLYYLLDKDDDCQKALTVDILIKDHKDSNNLIKEKDETLKKDKPPSVFARVVCIIEMQKNGKKISDEIYTSKKLLIETAEKLFPGTNGRSVYRVMNTIDPKHYDADIFKRHKLEDLELGRKLALEKSL